MRSATRKAVATGSTLPAPGSVEARGVPRPPLLAASHGSDPVGGGQGRRQRSDDRSPCSRAFPRLLLPVSHDRMKSPLRHLIALLLAGAPAAGKPPRSSLYPRRAVEHAGPCDGRTPSITSAWIRRRSRCSTHMLGADGKPKICDQVWISSARRRRDETRSEKQGKLTAGFGASDGEDRPGVHVRHLHGEGPDEPILLIKTAWGGKSLQHRFPPAESRAVCVQ